MPILLIEHGHSIYFYLVLKLQMNFIIIKNMKEPLSKPINPQKHAVWCDHCGKLIPKLTLKNTEVQCIRRKHIHAPVEAPRTYRRSQEPQKDYLGAPIIREGTPFGARRDARHNRNKPSGKTIFIKECATAIGLNDQFVFSYFFKNAMGCFPSCLLDLVENKFEVQPTRNTNER
ncbi:MAG: hypothetical protein R3B95_16420 [Nitrospirales bacterium]|nr:hypothetical protein [Nitrospirales bacterium]